MTLESMQRVVCLLLTDPGYRTRFFEDDPSRHAEHGLAADEFQALRAIDPAKLGIVSEGYMGKRIGALASALPRTWRTLQSLRPSFVSGYLAVAPHPRDGEDEAGRFAAFVRGLEGLPPDAGRFVRDLAAFELLLHETPVVQRLPSHRYQPDALRPRRAAGAMTMVAEGPLHLVESAVQPPLSYSPAPCELLAVRTGSGVRVEGLDAASANLLRACDGSATVAALAQRFGADAEAKLKRWLELGAVEPA